MWLLGNKERDHALWLATDALFSFYKIVDNYYYQLIDTTRYKVRLSSTECTGALR